MKKDEIVVLSNEIEIINGVEVDWSKYKGITSGRNLSRARKSYVELCELLHKNGHILESKYVNATTKIEIDFNCGHPAHSITPDKYKVGQGCPECAIKNKMDKSKEELYRIAKKNGHKILGEYINNSTPIVIDFKCGHSTHKISPNAYKQGRSCPKCHNSKGEKEISRILKEINIEYQEQYKFEDCICIKPLPFDFYIPEFNMCIEYDGEFHYKAVRYRKENEAEYDIALAQKVAEERLKERQRRDKIKTDYCRDNGINLIRIPYWQFDNIESILKKELSKYRQAVA